jgi:acyl carrier protein
MEMEAEKEARQTLLKIGVISITPDSLRSPEQKALLGKFEKIIYENLAIKNKRLEATVTKEEFKQTMEVPEIYYDILKKDIADINHYLDTTTSTVFDGIIDSFKASQDEYFVRKKQNELK